MTQRVKDIVERLGQAKGDTESIEALLSSTCFVMM